MENEGWNPQAVFTEQELRGFEMVTSGQARCAGCHELRLSHNIWQANNGLDVVPADPGATDELMSRGHRGVFRPPSLRNIEVTGPYMHDGRFATLRDVINHYDHGIQDSPELDGLLFGVAGSAMRLDLTEEDKDALEALLKTMTDQEFLTDPKFSDPFID
jgi:cytochrome c peroxidase